VPPLPPCPDGFSEHASGYWSKPDQKGSTGHNNSVAGCGAACAAKQGCEAFEVYDPELVTEPMAAGGSACYTFSDGLGQFTRDMRGLVRTCVRN